MIPVMVPVKHMMSESVTGPTFKGFPLRMYHWSECRWYVWTADGWVPE